MTSTILINDDFSYHALDKLHVLQNILTSIFWLSQGGCWDAESPGVNKRRQDVNAYGWHSSTGNTTFVIKLREMYGAPFQMKSDTCCCPFLTEIKCKNWCSRWLWQTVRHFLYVQVLLPFLETWNFRQYFHLVHLHATS